MRACQGDTAKINIKIKSSVKRQKQNLSTTWVVLCSGLCKPQGWNSNGEVRVYVILQSATSMCPLLTFLLANAFVFDNVFMVERLQDVDLAWEVGALLLTVLGLQGLHSHELASLVSPGIVATQLHLAKVALHEEQKTIVKELP